MKKIYTIVLFASCFFIKANAQSQFHMSNITPIPVDAKNINLTSGVLTLDTLMPPVFSMTCFTSDVSPLVYYGLGAAGYLTGSNSYGETEAAQRYAFTGSGTLTEVLVAYAKKSGTTATTSAKVYSINTAKKPGTALGTSGTVAISNITTNGSFTTYTFSPGVALTADFAVAAVLPTTASAGDTTAVLSTKGNCHSADSLAYVSIPNFGGYNFLNQLVNSSTPNNDTMMDLIIIPVVNVAGGVNEFPSNKGLTLMGAYPNPATDFTTLRYRLDESSTVAVKVFDITGKEIQTSSEKLSAGSHELRISLKGISAGNYYYTIKTDKSQLTSKFIVTK